VLAAEFRFTPITATAVLFAVADAEIVASVVALSLPGVWINAVEY
jgi:hypothetical protein